MIRSLIKRALKFTSDLQENVRKGRSGSNMSNRNTGSMTTAEAGRLGGKRTAATHDHNFYKKIGKRGGSKSRGPRSTQSRSKSYKKAS